MSNDKAASTREPWRLAAAWTIAVLLVLMSLAPIALGRTRVWVPIDLRAYAEAGQSLWSGLSLYAPSFADRTGSDLQFTYPPFAAVVFTPLGWLSAFWAATLWTLGSLAALAVVVRISFSGAVAGRAAPLRILLVGALTAAAVLTLPVTDVLSLGQIGILLVLLCLLAVGVPASDRRSGVLVGLASAIKLTPGLFVVYLALIGRWRAAAWAVATIALAWGMAAALSWPDTDDYFLGLAFLQDERVGDAALITNQSLRGFALRWGVPTPVLWLATGALLAVGLLRARAAHRSGALLAAATLAGLTTVLISPIAWVHHAVWVVPACGVIVADGRSTRRIAAALGVAAVAILAPVNAVVAEEIAAGLVEPWPLSLAREGLVLLWVALVVALPTSPAPQPDGPQPLVGQPPANSARGGSP